MRDTEAGTSGKEEDDLCEILGQLEKGVEGASEGVRDTPVTVSVSSSLAEVRFLPTLSFVSSGDGAGKKQSKSKRLEIWVVCRSVCSRSWFYLNLLGRGKLSFWIFP